MAFPDEVMAGSWTMYIAPAVQAQPATPATAPHANYILLGSQGSLNVDEAGITVRKTYESEDWYSLGLPVRVKSFTTREAVEVEFNMADMTAETLSHLLGGPATAAGDVVDTAPGAGTVGYRSLALARGFTNRQFTLLMRKAESAYDSTMVSEIWLPRVQAAGNADFVWVKNTPAVAHFFYKCIHDTTNGIGIYRAQDAAAA